MTEASDKPPIDHAFTGDRRGGAADPTYAGALSFMRRRYGKDIAGSDLVIWGVPFDLSVTNRPGTRFGPQAIRRASAIFDGDPQYPSGIDPFARLAAVDMAIVPCRAAISELAPAPSKRKPPASSLRAPISSRSVVTISSPCRCCALMSPATASWR